MSKRLHILLGRTGDLISMLPILQSEPASIMTCRQYADLLSGCSYADVIPFDGEETDLKGAFAQASKLSNDVKSIQVIGDTDSVKTFTYSPAGFESAQTDSFQKEPYKLLGKMKLWASQPRPVFDQRNPVREMGLTKQLPKRPEKCILVASKGRSSPFPYGDLLFELLQSRFGRRYSIVDLSTLRADVFYDFLGMLEGAHCLVTVDSAFLHLAHACENLPVVALVNDKPNLWFGSAWRANHIAHTRYSDFPMRCVEALEAIENIGKAGSWFNKVSRNPEHRRIIHVWSQYELTEEKEGHTKAKESWKTTYAYVLWIATPVEVGSFGRDSKHSKSVKDKGRVPFLKDVIRCACARAREDDLIVFTRCDTEFGKYFALQSDGLQLAYAHRYIVDENGNETWHPACDLFAFTKKWWEENQADIPDFWLGYDQFWNRVLREKIRRTGGTDLGFVIQRPPSTKTIQAGLRQQQNEYFHGQWQEKHGEIALAPPVVNQLPTVIVNRHALHPYGYNPSIIRYKDRLLISYRFHDQRDSSTALAIAEIDETGRVTRNRPILIPHTGGSEEDARFFMRGDELWLSYVDSTYPAMPPRCTVKYGRVVEDTGWKLQDIYQPNFGQNDMTGTEKNWLMFEHKETLYCFYTLSSYGDSEKENQTVLLQLDGSHVERDASYNSLRWAYGPIRGGTTPIPYKGYLLTFFHSALDGELPPYRRRYFVGALMMEAEPPFNPVSISKRPVLWGSELDSLGSMERGACSHWKSKCVLPFGAIDLGGGKILVSCGLNDSHCGLVTVTEDKMNFT